MTMNSKSNKSKTFGFGVAPNNSENTMNTKSSKSNN